MSLRDVDKKIYSSESDTPTEQRMNKYDPTAYHDSEHQQVSIGEEGMKPISRGFFQTNKKRAILFGGIGLLVILLAIGGVAGFSWWHAAAFSEENVQFSLEGPDTIESNSAAVFAFVIHNDNRAELQNTEVLIQFPGSFQPEESTNFHRDGSNSGNISIGTIAPGENKRVELKGKLFGSKDETVFLQATFVYSPQNITSRFQKEQQKAVTLLSSSFVIDIAAPLEAASGDEVEYLVQYKNVSSSTFYNTRMQMTYPEGFHMSTSDPSPSEGRTVWYLGGVGPGQSGEIKIRGTLEGKRDQQEKMQVAFGYVQGDGTFLAYSQQEVSTTVVASPLAIQQTVAGGGSDLSVSPGQSLDYQIQYTNDGDLGLRDAVVVFQAEGNIFDFSQAEVSTGAVDTKKQTITWRASEIPALASINPGQGGTIRFSLPIKHTFPVQSENDKNFSAQSVVTIDSPDVPVRLGTRRIVGQDTVRYKMQSVLVLHTQAVQAESTAPASQAPLVVGNQYNYDILLSLSNLYNDVKDATVSVTLPSAVMWQGVTQGDGQSVTYNDRTHQLTWNVGAVSGGTGILFPKKEIVFRVSLTPQDTQLHQPIIIAQGLEVTATDTFTGEKLHATSSDIKTASVSPVAPPPVQP